MRPGLVIAIVLGPVVALANQEATYGVDMWSCGHRFPGALHIVPILSVIVAGGALVTSFLSWRAGGMQTDDADVSLTSQTHFLSSVGMFTSGISLLVILAQWLGLLLFNPCAK